MQNITGLQFSADSNSCFRFIFHLVVDSSDDFADEFEGQSPKLSPLPLQTVRADQSLTHHSVKTPLQSAGADWDKISGREISHASRPSHTPTTNFETTDNNIFCMAIIIIT